MSEPTLLAYLAHESLKPIIRRGMFSREHVLFGDYMPRAVFLYEVGAALGYIFRDRATTFAKLFSDPGREADVLNQLGDTAAEKLKQLPEPPVDFIDLFFKPEATRLILILQRAGLTSCSHWSEFPKVANHRMRVGDVFRPLQFSAAEGIGFGNRYPELTEELATHRPDPETWKELRSCGLDIPASPPAPKTMQQRQAEARSMISPYVSAKRPELLAALEL